MMREIGCSHQREGFQDCMRHEKDMFLVLVISGHVN